MSRNVRLPQSIIRQLSVEVLGTITGQPFTTAKAADEMGETVTVVHGVSDAGIRILIAELEATIEFSEADTLLQDQLFHYIDKLSSTRFSD